MTRRSSCRPNAVCQRLSRTTCSGRVRPSRLTRGERAGDFFHVQIHLTPTPVSSLEHGTHDARICTSATSTARSHLGGIARDTRVELDVHPICAAPARAHGALRGHPGPPHTHIHKIYIIYSQRASKKYAIPTPAAHCAVVPCAWRGLCGIYGAFLAKKQQKKICNKKVAIAASSAVPCLNTANRARY